MSKKRLTVAYVSPGWPLSHLPNGIVAYIKNLISGFDTDVKAIILAHKVKASVSHRAVIDLSRLIKKRTLINKLTDKVLSYIGTKYLYETQYQRHWIDVSRRIIKGVCLLEKRPDLIEVEESFGIAKCLTTMTDIPVVTRLHGPWFIIGPIMKLENDKNYKSRVENEGLAIKASHGISAPSHYVLNKVREFYGCDFTDAKVIPNPVSPVPENLQWKYNSEARPIILFVGRFDLIKGGDLVLDAFRIIAKQQHDVGLLFVGPDRGVDIDCKKYNFSEYVETFIPEIEIRGRIHFLGHCNSGRIAELRQKALVTIIASRYETFSVSLLEALSTGSPVVSTSVGGLKEIVIHEFNGLLADPESRDSIAEKVLKLINDPENMKILSRNAINDSKNRFSPEIVAKQTLDFYETLLDGYGKHPEN